MNCFHVESMNFLLEFYFFLEKEVLRSIYTKLLRRQKCLVIEKKCFCFITGVQYINTDTNIKHFYRIHSKFHDFGFSEVAMNSCLPSNFFLVAFILDSFHFLAVFTTFLLPISNSMLKSLSIIDEKVALLVTQYLK